MNPADKSDVQAMFGRIAHRYDLMNRLMSFGRDQTWRRFLVQKANLSPQAWVLDIATGTGDIAFEIRRHFPSAQIIAADFALPMMQVGQRRRQGEEVFWVAADALALPFASQVFDAVVSGFLFRNVPDVDQTLSEHWRVLRPGGWMVTLDTTPPPHNLLRPMINLYFKWVIPTLGRIVTGDNTAYRYLPESTLVFKSAEALAERIEQAGFVQVGFKRFMLGTIAIHWAQKPD
jgi:demethylmenaquinone methyltransferase/2-methoxy-6-polyprenyl-1,4-benzoquinol methylase